KTMIRRGSACSSSRLTSLLPSDPVPPVIRTDLPLRNWVSRMRSITGASGYQVHVTLEGRDVRPAAGAIDLDVVAAIMLEVGAVPVHVGRDDDQLDRTGNLIIDQGALTFEPGCQGVGTREDEHLRDDDSEAVPAGLQVHLEPFPGGHEDVDDRAVGVA